MSIVSEILDWSEGRPDWQRDALRRLTGKTSLGEEDLQELTALCLEPHLDTDRSYDANPLAKEHLDFSRGQGSPTRLREVEAIEDVNALESGSTLPVAPTGITLVYGGNGTGKTGYVRILRQVCRARGKTSRVLSNVYEKQDEGAARARVRYQLEDEEPEELPEVLWEEGTEAPDTLQEISIFDRKSASVYVDQRQEVAYLPYGLDLLPRLADVCGQVRNRLEVRIGHLEEQSLRIPEVPEGTQAAELLENLNDNNAEKRLLELATISEREQERLAELNRQLAADKPEERAAELSSRSDRIGTLSSDLQTIIEDLSPQSVVSLRKKYEALESARKAVRLASEETFGDEPLDGTGSDPWRELWQAARKFSKEIALVDDPFPPGEGSPCLLCQQSLDDIAADRMNRFEEFVQSEIEDQVSEAEAALEKQVAEIEKLSLPSLEGMSADLEVEDEELLRDVRAAISSLEDRLEAVQNAEGHDDLEDLPPFTDTQLPVVTAHVAALVKERSRQQAAAGKDEERQALLHERNELEGRQTLSEWREDLLEEIKRRARIEALECAKRSTDTTAITKRSKKLTRDAVTEVIAGAFKREINKLQLDHLPIRVAGSRGERGTAYHRTELDANVSAPSRVLSRGEHRCVALAGFLAELCVQESEATVVLDDPVSSLDHDRREYVANRLVEVASDRPVLIFTHDLVFLYLLHRAAADIDVPVNAVRLERSEENVGKVVEQWPWEGMTLKQRVGQLKQLQQQAGAAYRDGRSGEYESMAREIYGYLREAWERGVEEILLNKAVVRFDRAVQTRRLRNLPEIEEKHIDAINEGMTTCSRYLRGHDDAVATMDPVPNPDEIKSDIDKLDQWRIEVQKIHN